MCVYMYVNSRMIEKILDSFKCLFHLLMMRIKLSSRILLLLFYKYNSVESIYLDDDDDDTDLLINKFLFLNFLFLFKTFGIFFF